jgi:hypothetical protein
MFKSKFKPLLLKRILASLIFIYLGFSLPWWLVLILGFALSFYFNNYYEYVLAGLIIDSIYGQVFVFENFSFIFTLITLVLCLIIIKFKKQLLI